MADKLLYLCIVLITSTTISNTECPPQSGTDELSQQVYMI